MYEHEKYSWTHQEEGKHLINNNNDKKKDKSF